MYLDTFFSFNVHCVQVANRVNKRNNVLNAMADTNWGQQKETLLLTYYKTLGRSIANYAAPVWSTHSSNTIVDGGWWLQTTQHTSGGAVTADPSSCANCVEPSHPQQLGPDLPFFGHAGHADPLDGWRCCSQKR